MIHRTKAGKDPGFDVLHPVNALAFPSYRLPFPARCIAFFKPTVLALDKGFLMVKRPKENPLTECILADSSEQGVQGVAALPHRLNRYGRAHQRALHMGDYAEQTGACHLAMKLRRCGHWLVFRHYYTVDSLRLHKADFCKKHLLMLLSNHRFSILCNYGSLCQNNRLLLQNFNLPLHLYPFLLLNLELSLQRSCLFTHF